MYSKRNSLPPYYATIQNAEQQSRQGHIQTGSQEMIDGFNSLEAPDFSLKKNRKLGKASVVSNYPNINRQYI